ncbi:MAG: histidine phosphatase family protein [Rhodospirillales bacterium]|jgi:broad specificity phosphatase PhoE|nr:histidine phosphatase family protein [Rhodospirillales bacterium]
MNDKVIYLLRHGETKWNREGRLQGHLDSPLTELGRIQAHKMGECLTRELNGAESYSMICSPLGRTRQTAKIACLVLGYEFEKCQFDDRLREVHLGEWDGLIFAEVETQFPEIWAERMLDKWNHIPPAGESYAMMKTRTEHWFSSLLPGSEPHVVVSHGLAGKAFRGVYAGLNESEMLSLHGPQDAIFKLSDGTIEEIPVEG